MNNESEENGGGAFSLGTTIQQDFEELGERWERKYRESK